MAPNSPRLRILSVGGNAVSAFLSWRLQATNACDVTLVWKSGFDSVAQYGISMRSSRFGNERFKPRMVVRTPEEAAHIQKGSFDYVLLCVKALPDVYDLAAVIESVVTPQHTCILINTSHSLGVESLIEERYPKNVVLSIVSKADIVQLGPAEFEHLGGADLWVGPANANKEIPVSIQTDMSEALAMTLGSGQVECQVSRNIQQQQFEHMAGPIAFHPTSVLFETPSHADLLGLTGVRDLISDAIDEILRIGEARGCQFPTDFKEKTMEEMIAPKDTNSVMYQDYTAKRPMEIETYLGSPMTLAKAAGIKVPRIETLYAMLHHVNIANQKRTGPPVDSTVANGAQPHTMPRTSSMVSMQAPPRGPGANGHHNGPTGPMRGPMGSHPGRGSRVPSMNGPPPPPGRRGPPPGPMGYGNGMPPRGSSQMQRRPSFEQSPLDEFSHVVLYDNPNEAYTDDQVNGFGGPSPTNDMALRERELMIRQKELALREREMAMRSGPRPGPGSRAPSHAGGFDDDDDDDYFDPMDYRGPQVDPDQVDMMSITSRRNRKQPNPGQLRQNPEVGGGPGRRGMPFGRPGPGRRASSNRYMDQNFGSIHENIAENPLLGYSSDRYGNVDRSNMGRESRTNSLTAARLSEFQQGGPYGGVPPPMNRRTSQSPGNPFGAGPRPQGRPPANAFPPNGMPNGGPSPPDMRQPIPRHPPGHGNAVSTHEVEQRAGVSNIDPSKSGPQVRSLTGSASASAGSGDSGRSANIDSEDSTAYSSQSSLGPRPPIGVR